MSYKQNKRAAADANQKAKDQAAGIDRNKNAMDAAAAAVAKASLSPIAKMNDLFRNTMITTANLKVTMTSGVAESADREAVITAVRAFDSFTEDNDPHKEHDFGAVEVNGTKYFFKIDYYDSNFEYGADPKEGPVSRLLTIMRADEY